MLLGRIVLPLLTAACLLPTLAEVAPANWTRFRGPNGSGVADDKDVPVQWQSQNILWKVPLPGPGNSSPVIWNDRLFVQSTNKAGDRILLCVDVKDGAIQWQHSVHSKKVEVPKKGHLVHPKNTFASSSAAVDAQRVYVVFWDNANLLMHAYTHAGQLVWAKDLGGFTSQHGAGASPIVFEDKIIFANDQDTKAVLLCLDAKTGNEVWHAERPYFRACYSSPLFRELANGKKELVVVSTKGVTGYDPLTGAQNWNWEGKFSGKKGEPLRTTSSPIYAHGTLFACSGDGGGDRHMLAVNLDGAPKVVWENRKDFPYVPCLLSVGDYLYFVNDHGVAGCYDARTGKQQWFERLGGACVSSPVLIDGKIYAANDDGDVFVIEATPARLNVLAKNSLGEMIRSTPAVADNRLYIRGQQHLFCIGKAR